MNGDEERRTRQRVDLDTELRVRVAGTDGDGTRCRLRDASAGGVAIVMAQTPAADTIRLEILTVDGHPIGDPLDARVVYVEQHADGGYRIGCRFDPPA